MPLRSTLETLPKPTKNCILSDCVVSNKLCFWYPKTLVGALPRPPKEGRLTERPKARSAGGRPRKALDEKRTERLSGVRLTAAERVHVEAQAALAGLSVAEFARRAVLGVRVAPRRSETDGRLLVEVNRVGVNLAQLVKALHFRQTPLVSEIEATVSEVRTVLDRLADDR